MIGSLIGAGVGLAGSIFGGIKAGQQRKKMDRYLNQQDADNQAFYNSNYYSNYLDRTDTQALMKNVRETLGKRNKASSNMAVVMGTTPEQQAIEKEQSNKVITDTASKIGAIGQQWKDGISDRYLNRKQSIAGQRMGMMEQKANSYENLMSSGLNMMSGSMGGMLGGMGSSGATSGAMGGLG